MGVARSRFLVLGMGLIVMAGGSRARAQERGVQVGLLITGILEVHQFDDEFHLTKEQREAARRATAETNKAFWDAGRGLKALNGDERTKAYRERLNKVAAEYEKALNSVLSVEQMKRLREICLQQMGDAALGVPELQERLHLTAEQKAKWLDLRQESFAEMREVMRLPADEQFERIKARRRESMQAAMGLLTEEQRKTWKAILGTPCPSLDRYNSDLLKQTVSKH